MNKRITIAFLSALLLRRARQLVRIYRRPRGALVLKPIRFESPSTVVRRTAAKRHHPQQHIGRPHALHEILPDADVVGELLFRDAHASTARRVQEAAEVSGLLDQGVVALDLPGFYHGCVDDEGVGGSDQEDREREEDEGCGEGYDEEVCKGVWGRAEVGWGVAGVVEGGKAGDEMVG